jgi:hypothetical protein
MLAIRNLTLALTAAVVVLLVPQSPPPHAASLPALTLVPGSVEEVVGRCTAISTWSMGCTSPGSEDNLYGFEGGAVVKVNGTYYWFPSEMVGDPHWLRMRVALWASLDGSHWARQQTLWVSSAVEDLVDTRSGVWAAMPLYDGTRWHLYYTGYASDSTGADLYGRAYHAVSMTAGPSGVVGPYADFGIAMWPNDAQSWEGNQGVDSFVAYGPVGATPTWFALYGSHGRPGSPATWSVGLASAPSAGGPWMRRQGNPLPIEPTFIENPVVVPVNGTWLAVYDTDVNDPGQVGLMASLDGVAWSRLPPLNVRPTPSATVRTPLGLIDEGRGRYTLFFTALDQGPGNHNIYGGYGNLYRATVTVS